MQGSTFTEREAWSMQGNMFQGKGGMVNAGQYLLGKGRHVQRRVVHSRGREAW